MFKKKTTNLHKLIPTAILASLFFSPLISKNAFALTLNEPPGVLPGSIDPTRVVSFILGILVVLGVVASIAFIIHGGYRWSTSGGDKQAVEAARSQVIAAVIGLIIVILSFVIIGFVLSLLGVGGGSLPSVFNIPSIVGGGGGGAGT